jgi:chromatin remodeling complex protein RSC6
MVCQNKMSSYTVISAADIKPNTVLQKIIGVVKYMKKVKLSKLLVKCLNSIMTKKIPVNYLKLL